MTIIGHSYSLVKNSAKCAPALDPMLRCYLDGELDVAAQHAVRVTLAAENEPIELVKLAQHIEAEFGAAKEFSATVDFLFGRAF